MSSAQIILQRHFFATCRTAFPMFFFFALQIALTLVFQSLEYPGGAYRQLMLLLQSQSSRNVIMSIIGPLKTASVQFISFFSCPSVFIMLSTYYVITSQFHVASSFTPSSSAKHGRCHRDRDTHTVNPPYKSISKPLLQLLIDFHRNFPTSF